MLSHHVEVVSIEEGRMLDERKNARRILRVFSSRESSTCGRRKNSNTVLVTLT